MTPTNEDILALTSKAMITRAVVAEALQYATPSQKQFLHKLLELEVASRWRSRITRLTKQAGFPQLKTLEAFNSAQHQPAGLPNPQ